MNWLSGFLVSIAILGHGSEPVDATTLGPDQIADLRGQCEAYGRTGVLDENVACLVGDITPDSPAALHDGTSGWTILVAHSPGGDVTAGIEIGRLLYERQAALIIDTLCLSSCANYLVPGAHDVYIPEGSVVALHGSVPRDHLTFGKMRSAALGYTREDFLADPSLALEIFDQFDAFRDQMVEPEVDFFADVYVPEGYVNRYWEVRRTLDLRPDYNCRPETGLLLVPGPIYFDAFNAGVVEIWWPDDRQVLLEPLQSYLSTYSVILDFDEHPIWDSETGLVDPATCEGAPPTAPSTP
jgi:hypothetical protein